MITYKQFEKIINYAIFFLFGVLVLLILVSVGVLEATKKPPEVRLRLKADMQNMVTLRDSMPKPWPPEMNQLYPDFSMVDQEGKLFKLSDLKGKVIILELVDMTNPLSHAYSGANQYGSYGTQMSVDPNVKTIQQMVMEFSRGALTFPNPDVVNIKLIFYNLDAMQPTPPDATNWAEHFKLSKADNIIVAVPEKDMRTTTTSNLLPGFQLIDKKFNLRVDSAGMVPKHNLELTLVPMVQKLL